MNDIGCTTKCIGSFFMEFKSAAARLCFPAVVVDLVSGDQHFLLPQQYFTPCSTALGADLGSIINGINNLDTLNCFQFHQHVRLTCFEWLAGWRFTYQY